jgi:uncharacterized protein involved in response to NO
MQPDESRRRIALKDLGKEPFRIFFPAAVLSGLIGVALWPLYFGGISDWYPGQNHARIMACGFFGGFIFGFLGTAMPRMLSAKPLGTGQTIALLSIYAAMVLSFAAGRIVLGDTLFLALLCFFVLGMAARAKQRKDTPPPGFVLVGLAFGCITAGTVLAILGNYREIDLVWMNLQRLLSYQGFVLLPILGIGPFILPRFFGLQSAHDFPEALVPSPDWKRKAILALVTGVVIISSFFIEAVGWHRVAHAIRFLATLVYLALEMPFHRAPAAGSALGASIRVAFVILLTGFISVSVFPQYRVSLLHLSLIGGFAIITFVVATRVVFGHSGYLERLKGPNRWLLVAVGLMLFGMATRISGDFWPKIMASHYIYGAIAWIAGVLLWSCYALPKVLKVDVE